MPGQDDLHTHLERALHDGIKILYLEPQQYTVSVWLGITISDAAVMVLYFETVQLKNKLSVPDQLLIDRAPMTALAAQQTLIPTATCFDIGNGDQRLRTHRNQRNNSSAPQLLPTPAHPGEGLAVSTPQGHRPFEADPGFCAVQDDPTCRLRPSLGKCARNRQPSAPKPARSFTGRSWKRERFRSALRKYIARPTPMAKGLCSAGTEQIEQIAFSSKACEKPGLGNPDAFTARLRKLLA